MAPASSVKRGERLGRAAADFVAYKIGTWGFVGFQTALIACWIASMATGFLGWDPYPFILLNLALSLQAAYTGPILLISANRIADEDRTAMRQMRKELHEIREELRGLRQLIEHRLPQ